MALIGNDIDGWILTYYDEDGVEHRVKFGVRPKDVMNKPPRVSLRRLRRHRDKVLKAYKKRCEKNKNESPS